MPLKFSALLSTTVLKTMEKLSARQGIYLLLGISLFLGILTLTRGLQSDDYVHRAVMQNDSLGTYEQLTHAFNLFDDVESRPWWFDEKLKVHFFRPLSALSHRLDYWFWPNTPELMHLHSVLWYVLLTLLCFLFFNRLFQERSIALIAGIIFCIDFSHFANVSWLANRNSLIAACLFVGTMYCYFMWRFEERRFSFYVASLLLFIASLLSSESSIAIVGIIFCFEVWHAKTNYEKQHHEKQHYKKNEKLQKINLFATVFTPLLATLCCYIIVAALWLVFYKNLGFGYENTNFYINPLGNIFSSLFILINKLPIYLFSLFFGIEGFYNVLSPFMRMVSSIICTALLFVLLFSIRNISNKPKIFLLFFSTTGMLVLPSFSAALDMRYNLHASIFSAAAIAIIIQHLVKLNDKSIIQRLALYCIITTCFFIAPTQWLLTGIRDFVTPQNHYEKLLKLKEQYPLSTIYILNYPKPIDAYYVNSMNHNSPIHILSNNTSQYSIQHNLPHSLILTMPRGALFKPNDISVSTSENWGKVDRRYADLQASAMLSKNKVFTEGEKIIRKGFSVEIMSITNNQLISKLRFNFYKQPNDTKNPVFLKTTQEGSFEKIL